MCVRAMILSTGTQLRLPLAELKDKVEKVTVNSLAKRNAGTS